MEPASPDIAYAWLEDPSSERIRGITALYRAEGWWTKPEDDPGHVRGIVAGSHCFLIALDGTEVVGMGRAISDRASDAYIQDVAVKASRRHKGIGSVIIRKLVERLEADGLHWVGLIAERGSQPFYEPLGFSAMRDSAPMILKKDAH